MADNDNTLRRIHCQDSISVNLDENSLVQGTDRKGEVRHIAHCDAAFHSITDLSDDVADFRMHGPPHRGEYGNKEVCVMLAQAITFVTGTVWSADQETPSDGRPWVDWIIRNENGQSWDVQVTRVGLEALGSALGAGKDVSGRQTFSQAATEIWPAIERKLSSQDPRTILALNIRYPGSHGFEPVVETFWQTYRTELQRRVRFAQVWLVGYTLETTFCIHPEFRRVTV
jgi:hypothetical protein